MERKEVLEELEKQKLANIRLEQRLEHKERQYESTVSKLQKDTGRSLDHFHSKWSDNLAQVQRQLDNKDGQLKICIQNID